MTADATVRGHGFCLALRVECYERPDVASGSDANWLAGSVELNVATTGAFSAKCWLSLFTSDVEQFRDELRRLDRELSGEATLHHVESRLQLTITLANGRGTMRGFVGEEIGAILRFDEIATDQTYVREALQQFDALTIAFPIRGKPLG